MADHFWVPGNSAGPHAFAVRKLLLHTTEGSSIEGAIAAYRANNSWPHLTVDFRVGKTWRICQHLGYHVAARSLRNQPGGVPTNTAGVLQIEVVGFASIPEAIDWRALGAELVQPLCHSEGIPLVSTVPWVAYPASYGQGAAQRLGGQAWLEYRGVLGHQHCPENTHGDPGAIPISAVLQTGTTQPPEEEDDDMPYLLRNAESGAIHLMGDPTTGPVHLFGTTAEDYAAQFKMVTCRLGSDAEWLVNRAVEITAAGLDTAADLDAIRTDLADEEPAPEQNL